MTKNDTLNKLDKLLENGNKLPEYKQDANFEYDKWYRKIKKIIESIFPSSEYIKELEKMKFKSDPMSQAHDNVFHSTGELNNYKKSLGNLQALIESCIEEVEEWEENSSREIKTTRYDNITVNMTNIINHKPKTKIFIVHGHDNGAKQEVARFIEKLGFEPIILHEQISEQMTIIEKIEAYAEQVNFGIILYTACDIGGKDKNTLQSRARQNVVFEHGYLIGKLGRKNVCPLVKGNIEKPGDIGGVIYMPMNESNSWHLPLAKELKAAGYNVDSSKLLQF